MSETISGAQSKGDDISWKQIKSNKESREVNPIGEALMNQAKTIYMNEKSNDVSEKDSNDLQIIVDTFNKVISDDKTFKKKFTFTFEEKKSDKVVKGKAKKLNSTELLKLSILQKKNKEQMDDFIQTLTLNKSMMPVKTNGGIKSFFSIVYWAISLLNNKKTDINIFVYLDCIISLYKSLKDFEEILSSISGEVYKLIETLQKIIFEKEGKSWFQFLNNNSQIFLECYWDSISTKTVSLYDHQREYTDQLIEHLYEKKLYLLHTPPATGKTTLAAILAKIISHRNKTSSNKKILLYICYNTIVRNEVAKLCITHNIDIKFWLAITKMDSHDSTMKTFLRAYMNCYPDWNRKHIRTKDEEKKYQQNRWKKFSENLTDQFEHCIYDTTPVSMQNRAIGNVLKANNLPEMIISDIDSSIKLIETYPDLFEVYFDEPNDLDLAKHTAKLLSIANSITIVSATLPKPEEISTIIENFRIRNHFEDNSFLKVFKSNKQHISCTFVNMEGIIFAPHDTVENIAALQNFIPMLDDPLIKRGYSPEVVFKMSEHLDSILPEEMKFNTQFPYLGMLNHETLREYACKILRFIAFSDDSRFFQMIKSIKMNKFKDMDINTTFTTSSINYQSHKTLHVATRENFGNHIENISTPFLTGSPKVSTILSKYKSECEIIQKSLESLEKNGNKDSEYEKNELRKELDNLKIEWPNEYIMNSKSHASKFGNSSSLINPNNTSFISKEDFGELDEISEKLLFSGIGVYQPENFNSSMMESFLKKKDNYKFILSTPSIIYGTNIALSLIDIDSSFLKDSTKNRLYQLIGRAGRRGKSNSAMIVFRDNEMIEMILKNDQVNVEALEIEKEFVKILEK